MFFREIRQNAARSRKSNALFFGSLVIAIIAFYTLLSLESQDVMRFLKTVESGAVEKLMLLIPFVYGISLFFVFFLVYFAYRYQMEDRKKELGIYLMMGMKRSSLFAMLMTETIWNSLISILLGLPIALLLTEMISLSAAKLVGIGIIGHKISLSAGAVAWTALGFMGIQVIAMLHLSAGYSGKEPVELLRSDAPEKQDMASAGRGGFYFGAGLLFLILAYGLGICFLRSFHIGVVALILLSGGSGTFLLYRGMGTFLGRQIQTKAPDKNGLFVFTGRQVQENVLKEYRALAVSSLLLLMACACISYGIGITAGRSTIDARAVDFTIDGSEEEVMEVLGSEEIQNMLTASYPMRLKYLDSESHSFSWSGVGEALKQQPETSLRNNMIENYSMRTESYLISLGSYNQLRVSLGKEPLVLLENQAALYTSMRDSGDLIHIMNQALKSGAFVTVDGKQYDLLPEFYFDDIVANRKITLYSALIVSDEDYEKWVTDPEEIYCFNALLNQETVDKNGLLQAIIEMSGILDQKGLVYESYLGGIGRNLFYTVSASYLTIYLGILFLLIANTVVGIKYLMQQRANKHRYITLLMLGAGIGELCKSAQSQIRLFFLLVLGVSAVNSIFAVWSMFTGFMKLPPGTSPIKAVMLSAAAFLLFLLAELAYIRIVEHASRQELLRLEAADRSS